MKIRFEFCLYIDMFLFVIWLYVLWFKFFKNYLECLKDGGKNYNFEFLNCVWFFFFLEDWKFIDMLINIEYDIKNKE